MVLQALLRPPSKELFITVLESLLSSPSMPGDVPFVAFLQCWLGGCPTHASGFELHKFGPQQRPSTWMAFLLRMSAGVRMRHPQYSSSDCVHSSWY